MKLLLTTLIFLFTFHSQAQIDGKIIHDSIKSNVYGHYRSYYIFLPENYERDSLKKYILGVVFDAQFSPYFTMVSSMMSYYEQTNQGEDMILLGIVSDNRQEEFIPYESDGKSKKVLGTERLTKFLKTEILPLIDTKYRTKDYKVGIGHSLGGSYLISNLFSKEAIFNSVIAASPNLILKDNLILNNAKQILNNEPELLKNKFLYVNVGTLGRMENRFREGVLKFDTIIQSKQVSTFNVQIEVIPHKKHMTSFVPAFDRAYQLLSSKFHLTKDSILSIAENKQLDFIQQIQNCYEEISGFTNNITTLNTQELRNIGYILSRANRHHLAIDVYHFALKNADTTQSLKINNQINYEKTHVLSQDAEKAAKKGNYTAASKLYKQAFALNAIRGTHMIRVRSVPILAQANAIELAFSQLELLANRYKLGGNGFFIDDPLCKPLRKDKRWKTIMKKLDENKSLYR